MEVLLLTTDPTSTTVLPAVHVLPVKVRSAAPEPASLVTAGPYDLLLLDARHDLAAARTLCRRLAADGLAVPILAMPSSPRAGWRPSARSGSSAMSYCPRPVRPRCTRGCGCFAVRTTNSANSGTISVGDLTIEKDTYIARLRGRRLGLAYREFELLKFLALHPGRVFTRDQLLTQVWGDDFFGGSRTVDVHIRRLRAELGPEHEPLIGTVRGVGYKMVPPPRTVPRDESAGVSA